MDCDICSECGEHADYEEIEGEEELLSNCCTAPPCSVDQEYDLDR